MSQKIRTFFIFLALESLLVCLSIRLVYIQFLRTGYFSELADCQHLLEIGLAGRRGTIYDRNMKPLALNMWQESLFADPTLVVQKKNQSRLLGAILKEDPHTINERLNQKTSFVWLSRKVPLEVSDEVRALRLKGIGFVEEGRRIYPKAHLASHVLGFSGIDDRGLEGAELFYNDLLLGERGFKFGVRDAKRRMLAGSEYNYLPARDGMNLVLAIDEVIQNFAEQGLDKIMEKNRPLGATIIVMDPFTGEVLALANRPTFAPNDFTNANPERHRNRAITDTFEPGSVFKIVVAAAALESGAARFADRYFCENGEYKFHGHTLHDHVGHGWLTFKEVIEKSSNIGVCKVAQKVGAETFYQYMKKFGFGKTTGIDLPGEVPGFVREPARWSKLSISAMPMGQEVTVTAIQLVCAMSAIANGGLKVSPHILKEIRSPTGEVVSSFTPLEKAAGGLMPPSAQTVRERGSLTGFTEKGKAKGEERVISRETADKLKELLRGAVIGGTATLARLEGYSAAGKTGTAQKLDDSRTRYSHDKFVASFVGFAPCDEPRVVIGVIVDQPKGAYFGGVVSAPIFREIALKTLRYLGVAPDEVLVRKGVGKVS